jgi:hypothetical protein
MGKRTFATMVKEIYEKARKPFAYILVAAAFGLRFFSGPEFAIASLTALGLVLLTIIFEIHKLVASKEVFERFSSFDDAIHKITPTIFEIHKSVSTKELPTGFSSFAKATSTIEHALDDYFQRTPNPTIQIIGISLFHQWPMLDPYLTNLLLRNNPPQLDLEIVLVDPTWTETKRLNPASSSTAASSIKKIKSFINQHKAEIKKYKWSIGVWKYRYTPHLFGILLGNNRLFVGRSFWDNGILRAGANEIEMFDTKDEHGSQKIKEFSGWFDKCKKKRVI